MLTPTTVAPSPRRWRRPFAKGELDQFFALVKNVDVNNRITDKLNLPAAEIKGERTPCLEGTQDGLYPALQAHGMSYDTRFNATASTDPPKPPNT